jgi:hypothetical protein
VPFCSHIKGGFNPKERPQFAATDLLFNYFRAAESIPGLQKILAKSDLQVLNQFLLKRWVKEGCICLGEFRSTGLTSDPLSSTSKRSLAILSLWYFCTVAPH